MRTDDYKQSPYTPAVPDGEFGIACESSLLVHTWHEYAGNRVYGVLSRLLFDGGYVSFRDSVPTYLLHQGLLRQQPRSGPRKRGGGEPLRPRDGKMECNGCLGGEILPMVALRIVWGRPSKRHCPQ